MNLFGTAGIRGSVADFVTPELALAVGRAVGGDAESVVLGTDGRVSSPALASALEAGLTSAGSAVTRVGTVPTPCLAFASQERHGVMVTASHNPPRDNGIKLFADGREYDADAEAGIEERVAADPGPTDWSRWGAVSASDPLRAYRDAVVEYAQGYGTEPDDVTVAVDCGNGVASVATPQALRAVGADVRALEANVDGYFPARESKPTPESLEALRSFVAGSEADIGIGHDGDADRVVVVDREGEVVHEDTVVAVLAEHYVRTTDAAEPVVVTTPNASGRIDERVEAAGGRVERVRLGALHEGIDRASGPVVFAAEPWKHVHPAFGGWIDGVVSATLVTRLVAEDGLDALREPVSERPYRKVSVDCPDDRKAAVMDALEGRLPDSFPDAAVETRYGVRLSLPGGDWALVRPSGTEPYVRVYAESDDVDELVDRVVAVVRDAVAETA